MRACIVVLFAIGCSSSSAVPATDDGGADVAAETAATELSADDFAQQLAQAICTEAKLCCTPVADCEATLTAKARAAVAPGLAYDAKAAAACVAAYRAHTTCVRRGVDTINVAECYPVVDGTKKPGEPCTSVEECQRGALGFDEVLGFVGCGSPKTGDPTVCIAFRPTGDAGAACNDNIPGDGFERVLCKPGLACVSNKCVQLPTVGKPCPDGRCADSQCTSGTCTAFPAVGDSCDGVCATGATCTSGKCVAEAPIIPFACVGFQCPSDSACAH